MMIAPAWLAANWRAIAALIVVAGLAMMALYYRGEAAIAEVSAARAEKTLAEFRGAYDLLAQAAQRQAAAVSELEQQAAVAAQRGAQARAEAQGTIDVAMHSAGALERAMAAPRPAGECPATEAIRVIRADLSGR